MFLPFLLVISGLRDLTPAGATAGRYRPSVVRMAAAVGFGDLSKHLLPTGDVEVRAWGGFAWGTRGIVLRRKAGVWTATGVTEGQHAAAIRLKGPKAGWPAFWKKAEALGVWTLPDEVQVKDRKGYSEIADGYSTLVEYQRDGVYRAYGYNNPGNQSTWPPAKPMAALDRFIQGSFRR